MTPEQLRQAAIALFGDRGWMSRLAEALGVDRSTVSRWFAGLPIPGPAAAAVRAWLQLQSLGAQLPGDPSSDEDGGSSAFQSQDASHSQIMLIEGRGPGGGARVGRVYPSRSGRTLTYRGQTFLRAQGFNANYVDMETGEPFWIAPVRRDGLDRLNSTQPVEIDSDAREDYERLRNEPSAPTR